MVRETQSLTEIEIEFEKCKQNHNKIRAQVVEAKEKYHDFVNENQFDRIEKSFNEKQAKIEEVCLFVFAFFVVVEKTD